MPPYLKAHFTVYCKFIIQKPMPMIIIRIEAKSQDPLLFQCLLCDVFYMTGNCVLVQLTSELIAIFVLPQPLGHVQLIALLNETKAKYFEKCQNAGRLLPNAQ